MWGLISRIDEGIWNRVWAFTDDGRPLELTKLDVALIPRVHPIPKCTDDSLFMLRRRVHQQIFLR